MVPDPVILAIINLSCQLDTTLVPWSLQAHNHFIMRDTFISSSMVPIIFDNYNAKFNSSETQGRAPPIKEKSKLHSFSKYTVVALVNFYGQLDTSWDNLEGGS